MGARTPCGHTGDFGLNGPGSPVGGRVRTAGKADHTLASFRVDDLDLAMADLRAAGIEFEDYDLPGFKTVDGVVDWGHTREAWFKDSDANVLSLAQLIEP